MGDSSKLISFGPVPSRRLGHSLGINNIPHKARTYSCVYCQVGRTRKFQFQRQDFYNPNDIVRDVEKRIKEAELKAEPIDYLTFVPDGEPTLDENLGKEIDLLKTFGIKIAVITNASIVRDPEVREDLQRADWVSVKVDAVNNSVWNKINRAHRSLKLERVLNGLLDFSLSFDGVLATETMLIHNVNDSAKELYQIAEFISKLKPAKSFIAIPTRPPVEKWVNASSAYNLARSYAVFKELSIEIEFLTGYEGNAFAFTGNIEEDLLSITSVHPMREHAVQKYLAKAGSQWEIVDCLIENGKLIEVLYEDNKFYIRNFS